jgi:hypothetical protein
MKKRKRDYSNTVFNCASFKVLTATDKDPRFTGCNVTTTELLDFEDEGNKIL